MPSIDGMSLITSSDGSVDGMSTRKRRTFISGFEECSAFICNEESSCCFDDDNLVEVNLSSTTDTPNISNLNMEYSTFRMNDSYETNALPSVADLGINLVDVEVLFDTTLPNHSNPGCQQQITRRRRTRSVRDNIYDVPSQPSSLPAAPPCCHCRAKRFHLEPKGFCCSDGKVMLTSHDAPTNLYDLFTSTTEIATEFRTYVRTYNNSFAFTSFGVKCNKDLCKTNRGVYTFTAQGQIYHYLNALLPCNERPCHLQLYFYDTDHEMENRLACSDRMKPQIMKTLIHVLQNNPYCRFFRSLGDISNLPERSIIIRNSVALDQRVYNAPVVSQVAAIWVEGNENESSRGRDIIVHSNPGFSHRVKYYYGCYDPLQYPLLFPFGEAGWHEGIERAKRLDETKRAVEQEKNIWTAEQLLNEEERGNFHDYRSFDQPTDKIQQGLQEDFFNTLTPSGFPPHILRLKENCPVILLRNIDPSKGLCNGTRLICKTFDRNSIGATIAVGSHQGKHVFIPRIPLLPTESESNAFPFQRTQFPIRLSFAMTINKAQGQTLDFVGIYLPQPVFSHGQLYVALSRAKKASCVAMVVVPTEQTFSIETTTRNVVYQEVLALAAKD